MSAAFTPGPYLIAGSDKAFVYALNDQGYNRFSAHIQGGHVSPLVRTSMEEREAVARLFATAPEMLGLLRRMEEQFDDNPTVGLSLFIDDIRAVIAKAEGGAA